MPVKIYEYTGIVYSLQLSGEGGPTSNDGIIGVSPQGTNEGVISIYLTGPGTNEIHTVTREQFQSRVAAIYRSYCRRTPLTFKLRSDGGLPLILSVTMTI